MLTIFDKSFDQGVSLKDKLTYLNGTNQLTTFRTHDKELQSVTAKILLLLGKPNSRLEGLTLLNTVLNQCHQDMFVSNAKAWAQSAITVLKSSDSRICKELACSILNMILVNLVHIPNLRSEVTSAIFPELIPVLMSNSSDDECIFAATKCLSVCMQNFPTLLAMYQKNIENYLTAQVDTLVCAEVVADCYAQLPYCHPKGGNNAYCRDAWLTQFQKLLNTLHLILNDFLFEVEDTTIRAQFAQLDEQNLTNFIPPLENIYSLLMVQARVFSVISRTLAKMMCSKSLFSLNIPIVSVLHLVHRLLAVSIDDKGCRSADEIHLLFSLLPDMQCSTLTVFEALILSCQNNLIQHANFIGEIFVQSFKISREIKFMHSGLSSLESPYRQTILKVLIIWLKRLGRGGSFEVLKHQDLIMELLNDILPKEPPQIEVSSNLKKASSEISNQVVQKEICDDSIPLFYIEALRALSTIVYVSGNSMDLYVLKTILQQVLFILNKIQYLPVIPAPYYDARCRKKLYSLLLTTVITAAPYFKQSVSASAKIFKFGLRDSSEQVSGICNKAFTYLNPTLHPTRACPEAPAPPPMQPTGPQYSNGYTQNKSVNDNLVPWTVNGVDNLQFVPTSNDMEEEEEEGIEYSPMGDSSPEVSNHEDECSGVERGPQSSSHDDNESVEEEEEESEDMEDEEESEEMDNGLPMLSDSPTYVPNRNSVSSHAKAMDEHDVVAEYNVVAEHEILYSNSVEISTGYDNQAAESELLNNQEDCHNESINQNGVYETSEEEVEKEEAELERDTGESAPTLSKKRALENSFETASPKKIHAESMDQEPAEDTTQEEAPEQNALEMIGDFVSMSPDESQS